MRKILKRILILTIIFLCIILTNKIYAKGFQLEMPEITEAYKKWSKLSEEEKKNTIQPSLFSIPFDTNNSLYKSSRMYMLNNLKVSLGASYNLTDEIQVKVKNQGRQNRCWAFSLSSVLETTIAKMSRGTSNESFSPAHMDYWVYNNFGTSFNNGGNSIYGFAYYASGAGPIDDSDELTAYIDQYTNDDSHTNSLNYPDSYISKLESKYQVEQYTRFPTIEKIYETNDKYINSDGTEKGTLSQTEVNQVRSSIKEHIQKYGAVTSYTAYYTKYLNYENFAYFCNKEEDINHQITIVGWDDEFPKEKFNIEPPEKGAWIVLNSWGEEDPRSNKGYYYISYYDRYIEYGAYGVNKISKNDYSNIYQYDELGYSVPLIDDSTNKLYEANMFDKKQSSGNKKEYLKEVSFYILEPTNIDIYYAKWDKVNKKILGEKKLIKSLTSSEISENGYFTYYTYKLNEDEYIEIDESFAVILKYSSTNNEIYMPLEVYFKRISDNYSNEAWKNATSDGEGGYISFDSDEWTSVHDITVDSEDYVFYMENADLCIKAFTTYLDEINVKSISLNTDKSEMNIGDMLQLTATITPNNATNKEITWQSSNEEVAIVDQNGKVTALALGKTTITATAKDQAKVASCVIIVNEKNNENITEEETQNISVTQIDLDITQREIYIGDTFTLNAIITPNNASNKDLTWKSEDKSIATVSSDGKVTGKSKGIVTITATNNISGKSAICVVTVLDKAEDEYYKELEEKVSEYIDNNSENINDNKSDENIFSSDNTIYTSIIPQTGIRNGIKITLIIIGAFGIISFVKFYRKRDIK